MGVGAGTGHGRGGRMGWGGVQRVRVPGGQAGDSTGMASPEACGQSSDGVHTWLVGRIMKQLAVSYGLVLACVYGQGTMAYEGWAEGRLTGTESRCHHHLLQVPHAWQRLTKMPPVYSMRSQDAGKSVFLSWFHASLLSLPSGLDFRVVCVTGLDMVPFPLDTPALRSEQ